MDRLFAVITRINSVLFLIALLGICGLIAYWTWGVGHFQTRGQIEVGAANSEGKSSLLLEIGRVERIVGTETEMMPLEAREKGSAFSSGPGYRTEIRNLAFVSAHEAKARWLFEKQSNLILAFAQLRPKAEATGKDNSPTESIYVEYVDQDTNGDGRLSADDRSNVAVTKANGAGMVKVLTGVNRVLSYDVDGEQQVSIIYQSGKAIRQSKISLSSFSQESDVELTTIPDAL